MTIYNTVNSLDFRFFLKMKNLTKNIILECEDQESLR